MADKSFDAFVFCQGRGIMVLGIVLSFLAALAAAEGGEDVMEYHLKSWPSYRLRGVNINVDHSPVTREDLRHLAEDWGANHVRVQIFTAGVPLEYGETPGAVLDYLKRKVDPVLEWCREFQLAVVLDSHGAPGNPKHWSERPLWEDFKWHETFARLWREIAEYYRENRTIVAYELLNEPNMRQQVEGTPSDWNALARKLTAAIREVDDYHTIMVGPIAWSNPGGFESLEPTGDPNTIYTFHMYQPHAFTHQGVRNQRVGIAYPGEIEGRRVDKQVLREMMGPAIAFQKRYHLPRLYVGEFSAIIWAPGRSAYNYLRDLLELFEEQGWDWAYHAYREWVGWSLEHEATSREDVRRVGSTDRLELFKGYFAKNLPMRNKDRIQPYAENPFYWQYKGQPVLLLGGSVEDNLFQIPDLEEHLDLLHSVGGNYVRCTMSSRDEGNVWPFERDPKTGLYDLNKPGEAYWRRFERFLKLTAERDIIVQIELWDRFDFARDPWQANPYNPKNNVNYTAEESGLKEVITTHPGQRENAFFRTVPALENNQVVLPYQQAQVDRLLSIALPYGHVLYCMDNETNESPEWGAYWARYIQRKAGEMGLTVQTTEMWDAHNILDAQHLATLDHPELYQFVDISQNNHQSGETHWLNPQEIRRRIQASGHIRPMNSVKIYGADTGRFGTSRDGQERFWRNLFGGLASSRFHRPPSGLGLSETAQAHLRSMRMLTDAMTIFQCEPHNDLLSERDPNEAYCTANPGVEYAVFFPDGGDVLLDVSAAEGRPITVAWLNILESRWEGEPTPAELEQGRFLRLTTPQEKGYWTALVKVEPQP